MRGELEGGASDPGRQPSAGGQGMWTLPSARPYSSGAHSWQDSSPPTAPHPDLPWWEQSGAVSEADAPPLVKPRLLTRGAAPRAPVLGDLGKRPWQSSRGSPWRRFFLPLQKERASQPRGHLFFAVFTLKRLRLRRRHCLPPRPTVRGAGWSPDPSRFQPAAVQAEFAASGPACWAKEPGLPGTSGADKCLMVRVLLLPFLPGIQVLRGGDPL